MRYYNSTRAPLPLSLPHQRSVSVPGRGYVELTPEEAGTESVQQALAGGVLRALPVLSEAVRAGPVEPASAGELRFPGVSYDAVRPEAVEGVAAAEPAEPEPIGPEADVPLNLSGEVFRG